MKICKRHYDTVGKYESMIDRGLRGNASYSNSDAEGIHTPQKDAGKSIHHDCTMIAISRKANGRSKNDGVRSSGQSPSVG